MAALTDSRNTPTLLGTVRSFPVAASVTIYAGSIVSLDTSGYVRPGRASVTDKCVGVALATVTNGTTAGAVSVDVDSGAIARFGNSGSIALAHVGQSCYVVDDQTVSLTDNANTRIRAGRVFQVDSTGVWVNFGAKAEIVTCTVHFADVSAADTVYHAAPVTGRIVKIISTLYGAITTADSALTTSISGVAITGGASTIAYSGSAAGTTFTATPTAAHYCSVGQYLSAATDGASSTTAKMSTTFVIEVG